MSQYFLLHLSHSFGSCFGTICQSFHRNQLRNLIAPRSGPAGTHAFIFNSTALSDISSALYHCQSIFSQIKKYLDRATKQAKGIRPRSDSKIKLSRSERAKWPFLQSPFNDLRNDLRDSKINLVLMLAVADLAIKQKAKTSRGIDDQEQTEMKATIARLQRAGTLRARDFDDDPEDEKVTGVKRLYQKTSSWKGGRRKE